MDRDLVLRMVRTDITRIVENMTLQNVQESRQNILRYLDLVQVLSDIPEYAPLADAQIQEVNTQSSEPFTYDACNLGQSQAPSTPCIGSRYEFKRTLRGGIIQDLNYHVGESIVRQEGIEHGDIVEIVDIKNDSERGVRYYLKVAEKRGLSLDERRVIRFAIVEKVGFRHVIRREPNGLDLRLNGVPYTFVISDQDVFQFNLNEGDVIEFAYYEGRPESGKVVWKYDTSEWACDMDDDKPKATPRPQVVTIEERPKTAKRPNADRTLFQDRRIVLVGGDAGQARANIFRDNIERLGAVLDVLTGEENRNTFKARIRRADAVLVMIGHVAHQAYYDAVKWAKEYGAECETFGTPGIQQLIMAAETALKRRCDKSTTDLKVVVG